MIAIGGYSRFPAFYSSDARKNIGFESDSQEFNDYVKRLRGNFIAVRSLRDLKFTSRFAVNDTAINPELETKEEIPRHLYVYPDTRPTKVISDAFATGFKLKGGRNGIFVPLLIQRVLTKKETNALLKTTKVKQFGFVRLETFLRNMGIDHDARELADGTMILRIRDPELRGQEYRVRVGANGRVLNVDFCIHGHENYFITELIMFVRNDGSVYHIGGFHY